MKAFVRCSTAAVSILRHVVFHESLQTVDYRVFDCVPCMCPFLM
jgi:hypothetical protein